MNEEADKTYEKIKSSILGTDTPKQLQKAYERYQMICERLKLKFPKMEVK